MCVALTKNYDQSLAQQVAQFWNQTRETLEILPIAISYQKCILANKIPSDCIRLVYEFSGQVNSHATQYLHLINHKHRIKERKVNRM